MGTSMMARLTSCWQAQLGPFRDAPRTGARIVMSALQQASDGQLVLHPLGQQSEWLHRRFLSSQLDIGLATWKYFKRTYFDHIELDDSQQWVRLRPSAVGG